MRSNKALGVTLMRALVIAITAASLSACLPVYVPKRISAPLNQDRVDLDAKEKVSVGDKVTVYTLKRRTEQFEVTRLEATGFVGVAWDKKQYRVNYADLEKMWVTRWGWDILVLNGGLH